jgi:Fic family protein
VLYTTPTIDAATEEQLRGLDELRGRLGRATGAPGPWLGQLRREVRADAFESSVSIEGFSVSHADAVAIVAGERQPDPADEDRMAVACYARAMDHVGAMAVDPAFRWLDRVVLDLHFDACWFQRDRAPGLWRTDAIAVTAPGRPGQLAYIAPDAGDAVTLMDEVVAWLQDGDLDAHVVVRAAMAHLHVVSVHPFRDGNGRIARIVQSLVLARAGLLAPELSSIESHLAAHTGDYYRVLQDVQGGRYQPGRDAMPWVRFCVEAHIQQAQDRLRQVASATHRWSFLEQLVDERRWPDRLVVALEQSLFTGVERAAYVAEADVSPATASADLRRLVDAGLVEARGRTRSVRYVATHDLRRRVDAHLASRRAEPDQAA